MTIDAYPLTWPYPQPRTESQRRQPARFQVNTSDALNDLRLELARLGTRHVVISSCVPVRRDGLPYTDTREPDDPGVAVYFDRFVNPGAVDGAWRPFVIACDHYTKFRWNLRAIGMTVEALRTIQRHGASSMLEQAFTGFAALPPASVKKPWWEVLGVPQSAAHDIARTAYLELVRVHHPDAGGSN